MKALKLTIITLAVAALSSCSITQPLYLTNNAIGSKVGKSTTGSIFGAGASSAGRYAPMYGYSAGYYGLTFNKNFGIYEAAKQGGISKIATVDMRTDWYVFFTKRTYIVTGE